MNDSYFVILIENILINDLRKINDPLNLFFLYFSIFSFSYSLFLTIYNITSTF